MHVRICCTHVGLMFGIVGNVELIRCQLDVQDLLVVGPGSESCIALVHTPLVVQIGS